ncbi:uncharacterized protein PHALS_01131 [Plasmopara halstedii]|uniref:Uncharacterized protein n=1 Tax=Plasmopara halstedii TaxID=4781 RepID=A0A0P1AVS7_PLAHL|nr:uncharacterized protein PHALS_01131 [Plasmopara halstedii]CEG44794.1 hypothetical protein PHALS_01131 [Plasmopara halstedii]|eukprot:XP_024581163.1 hypothetical protein PHALS_01131 [Plasmopara halstedii]
MLPERLYEGRGDAMRSKEERSRRFRILCFGDKKAWAMVSAKKAVPKRRAFTGSP